MMVRIWLTLLTILCCTTISGAVVQETQAGAGFKKTCAHEGEIGFWAELDAPKTTPSKFFGNTRLEVEALQKQGLSRSEAFQQIRSFNAGNADGFHLTTQKGARGILDDGFISPSRSGVAGPGVYSGTTPTPGPFLKNVPFAGWGLGGKGANVRIPFQTSQTPVTPWLPPKTQVFRNPVSIGGN